MGDLSPFNWVFPWSLGMRGHHQRPRSWPCGRRATCCRLIGLSLGAEVCEVAFLVLGFSLVAVFFKHFLNPPMLHSPHSNFFMRLII